MERTYVSLYIDKNLAEQYKQLESVEAQEEAVKKLILRKGLDLEEENEHLSESLLQFKHVCLKHKIELQKVYNEQSENLYNLWESCGDVTSQISKHAKSIATEIEQINRSIAHTSSDVDKLKEKINSVNIYGAERIVELAKMIAKLDDATKDILSQILTKKI
jgi:uncharacterized coiled-coil DUF342 family protein